MRGARTCIADYRRLKGYHVDKVQEVQVRAGPVANLKPPKPIGIFSSDRASSKFARLCLIGLAALSSDTRFGGSRALPQGSPHQRPPAAPPSQPLCQPAPSRQCPARLLPCAMDSPPAVPHWHLLTRSQVRVACVTLLVRMQQAGMNPKLKQSQGN